MKRISWLISKYLITTILPYFVFSWLLLSVILFVQQAGRYADIFFSVNIPANLVWQLTVALIPNVIAFTCPMAMLVGTIIGLTKMQGDSELVVIRASGVGNLQIAVPILILGIFLSVFAFFVNLKGVPLAATLVRSVALQTAIKKLESPLEPGVFNSEVAGYTIYVKGGDFETGRWKNIFIYNEDPAAGTVRLITSQNGRIDTSGQLSELVLENAVSSTLPMSPGQGKYVSENIGEVRLAIRTKRSELIDKLGGPGVTPDELGLQQLSEYADANDGKERVEAQILWQRRIILSITPLIFCILGTVIVLRFNRGGRGFGILLALVVLIGFYLLAFLGEQLARVGAVSVIVGGLIPLVGSFLAALWLGYSRVGDILGGLISTLQPRVKGLLNAPNKIQIRNLFVDMTTGLRDFDILYNLLKNYLLTLSFLSVIFLIFTAFELWKFAGTIDGGVFLLLKYLFYLMPFVYLQIAPSAAMIAILATYVIKSRQNEIVTWTAAGQSVYRLLTPCLLLMLVIGGVNWLVQEGLLAEANKRQDAARTLIRNGGVPPNRSGKYWVTGDDRIYSFDIGSGKEQGATVSKSASVESASDNDNVVRHELEVQKGGFNSFDDRAISASDNERRIGNYPGGRSDRWTADSGAVEFASDNEIQIGNFPVFERETDCRSGCVSNLTAYEFTNNGQNLQSVYRSDRAVWESGHIRLLGRAEKNELVNGRISTTVLDSRELDESSNPFTQLRTKPNHLNAFELKGQIMAAESDLDRRNLTVALERKYTTLFLPFVMALFTAPFSLSLNRKGKAATVGYAIGLWLLFTGTSVVIEQFGLNGLLSPSLAVWSPLVFFSLIGIYLLSKVRT